MNKLPNGWTQSTFGECLQYEQPTKYIVKSTKYNNNYKTPVLTAGKSFILGYTNETDGIFTQTPVIIFDDFTTDTKFVDFHFKVKSSAMKILMPNGKADIKFLYYLMQIIYHRSDTHKRYWISEYSKIKIPLPPLETQKQIAERLDFLFDKIDKALKLLNENKEYIKKYRLSILKDAFEGKLTRPSKNWEIKTLGDVYEITSSKRVFKKEWKKEGIPFYRARDIVSFSKNEAIKSPLFISYNMYNEYSKKYGIPSEDDILVTGVGTIGIPYLVKSDDKFYFKDGNIIWLKKKSDKIFSKYVYYLFFSNLLELNSRGSTVLTYTIIHAKNTKIPLPPLETQKEIVSILDTKFKSMEEIERLNNENIENLLLLKKSLLKEAFSGN